MMHSKKDEVRSHPLPKVLLVQPIFAHYRFGTLELLSRSSQLEVSSAAGDTAEGGQSIAVFDASLLPRAHALTNRWFGPVLWQTGLAGLMFRGKWDVVILSGSVHNLSTWVWAIICRLMGRKVLFWTTGWHRPDSGIRRILRLAQYRLAHRLLLYAERGAEIGAEMGYPPDRMDVIFNSERSPALDTGFPEPANVVADFDRAFVVVVVGRLTRAKRLDLLIAAVAHSNADRPIQVVMAGEGPEREHLSQLASKAGVAVAFVGPKYDQSSLADLYRAADLTVVPGAAGLSVVQSMRFGVPVVSHNDPDMQVAEWEAIREGKTGWHFKEGDPAHLATVIQRVAGLSQDEKAQISIECRREYELRWTPEVHAGRIEASVMHAISPQGCRNA